MFKKKIRPACQDRTGSLKNTECLTEVQWLTSLPRGSLLLSRKFDPHQVQHLYDETKQGFVNSTSEIDL